MNNSRLRVLVVDDSPYYLAALSSLLAIFPCVGIIQTAQSATEALGMINLALSSNLVGALPDLVLLDIELPDGNGLDLARMIKTVSRGSERDTPLPPKIVIVTLYDIPAYREAAEAAGTDGFLSKADLGERLQKVIGDLFPQACPPAGPAELTRQASRDDRTVTSGQGTLQENRQPAHC